MTARLIYVVGASGCGKDSLLRYCRERLGSAPWVQFAHRYITRAVYAGGENHVPLSVQEFAVRAQAGLFSLHWASHGHRYGIGVEIEQWLARDIAVVVNGSRDYLPEARKRYPGLAAIWIEVSPELLYQRLLERGRESAAEIAARLARHQAMPRPDADGVIISNDGALADAGQALIAAIRRQCGRD